MKYDRLLEDYLKGAAMLTAKAGNLSADILNYRPRRADAWTIKEHIIHLADSETNGFIRCKSIIAQPNTECYVMDEELWTKNLTRKNEDANMYLQLFSLIRHIVFELLRDEPEENWNRDYFIREYGGERKQITIAQCIELYHNHLGFHMEYMDRILEEKR